MTLVRVMIERDTKVPVAHLYGEIDLSNADAVRGQVIAAVPADAPGLVLDLSETTYLDSSGVRLLFEIAERLQARRQRLALVVTEAALVRRVLVLTKLDDAVPLHPALDEAIAALA